MQRDYYERDADGFYRIVKGKAEFIADHRVLIDFAADLAAGLPDNWSYPALIVLGSAKIPRPRDRSRPVIGIQTEHLLDASGAKMWAGAAISRHEIRLMIRSYDHILDLSVHNAAYYQYVNELQLKKLTCGPYVFPSEPVPFQEGGSAPLFVGWYKARRQSIVNQVKEKYPVEVLSKAAWGDDLLDILAQHKAILNIHFRPGAYAEAPRILKAYRSGKPVLTEELGYPFVMGRHVLNLYETHPEEKFRSAFDRFSEEIAMRYTFGDYVKSVVSKG